ncbi:MAG: DUF2917 domain-containing protein [Desulfuromonadaceae bacterium]|nr:DUF2917 domain-containing protein [Desulfuromonadaceae bacterium]MDD5105702.1 DUF2917 domain-containing protein [Desulfuromonadaceae bacterium]
MEYILKKGEVMSLTAAERSVIRVQVGEVWLTSGDDSRDYFLQRGDSFAKNGDGLVVLESLADCTFTIRSLDAAPGRVTIQLTLAGAPKAGI